MSAPVDPPIDIILGRDLFASTFADIDIKNEKINFIDYNSAVKFSSVKSIPLNQSERGTPHIPIEINSAQSIEAAFDIGYNASLLISPAFADQIDLLSGKRVSTVASVGVEGVGVSRVATLSTLILGAVKMRNVPIEVPPFWNRSMPAIVGLEILRRFSIFTDYRNKRIWLSPHPELIDTPLPKDRSGIGASPSADGLLVVHVSQ